MVSKYKILVIDDEPSVADALKLILEDNGYTAVLAKTGREGLRQVSARPFDLTILDLWLPDLSGRDVLSAIHERRPGVPVIMITARATPELLSELTGRGAADLLLKPFTPSQILDAVATALASRRVSHA